MTKEVEELQNTVAALREAYNAKVHEVTVLNTEAGKLRAEIDNLQAAALNPSAPTILDILTQEGFSRFCDAFPDGLRLSGRPVAATETAISVIGGLVRRIAKHESALRDADAGHTELAKAYSNSLEQNVDLAIGLARATRSLAEYAMRNTEAEEEKTSEESE